MIGWLLCLIGDHDWTCRAAQGLKPLLEDMPKKGDNEKTTLAKFRRYATMYCKRCYKVYVPP